VAGRWLRRLHALTPPRETPVFDYAWCLRDAGRRAVAHGLCSETAARALVVPAVAAFAARRDAAPLVLSHGDCRPAHVLLGADGEIAGVLDFGDASIGDPLWDIAVLTCHHTARLGDVVAGYRHGPLDGAEARALLAFRVLRHLSAANWRADNGSDPQGELAALRSLTVPTMAAADG
jgi:aminoglycoside phosphotransferase (APT) family kinase protein